MIGEVNIYGVFVPSLLVIVGVALLVAAALRRILALCGFYRLVWHRPLFDLALLVLVTGALVALSRGWTPP